MGLINPNKKYKKLVTSGCSFTQGHKLGEKVSWGYNLAQLLNCEHINKGMGGSSNQHILSKIINYCENNDMTDCCVGIQWSEITRREMWIKKDQNYFVFNMSATNENVINIGRKPSELFFIKDNPYFFEDIWFDTIENLLRTINSIILAKSYLESKNIDYVMFEGLLSILDKDLDFEVNKNNIELTLINKEYRQSLLKNNTFFTEYGDMISNMRNHPLYDSVPNDGHPNLEFVKWWVQEMYDYMLNQFLI